MSGPLRPVLDDGPPTIGEVRALRAAAVSMADELIERRAAVRQLNAEIAELNAEVVVLRAKCEELLAANAQLDERNAELGLALEKREQELCWVEMGAER